MRIAVKKIFGFGAIASGVFILSDSKRRESLAILTEGVVRTSYTFYTGCIVICDYKLLKWRAEKDTEEYAKEIEKCHRRSSSRVLKLCKWNKGIYTKAGQHIASLNGFAPQEYIQQMSVLQDKADFQPIEKVQETIKSEFGRDLNQLFLNFDSTPIASASLAQVHKAVTMDGKEVAVKVQYTDVSRLFETDLMAMKIMSNLIGYLFQDFQLGWVVEEFDKNMREELDFINEAKNSEKVKKNIVPFLKTLKVPEIFWDMTSKKVLTMEFIHGCKVSDSNLMKSWGIDTKKVSNTLIDLFGDMIFCQGFVHCDPHPGNILIQKDKETGFKLVLLDHGLYRQLDESFRIEYCHLWKAIGEFDDKQLKESSKKLGAEKYYEFFPLLFTARVWSSKSQTPIGSGITQNDREAIRATMKDVTFSDLLVFFEKLPRDLLLVLRTNNLVRSVNKDLEGTAKQRYRSFMRYAIKGIYLPKGKHESDLGIWKRLLYNYSLYCLEAKLFFADLTFKLMNYFSPSEKNKIVRGMNG